MVGDRGGASQECVAQGVANVATGFFGGMGGCAMIGQSMINVNSGGRTRFAAVASALFLLLFIYFHQDTVDLLFPSPLRCRRRLSSIASQML